MVPIPSGIITLTTDFGSRDAYVAAMKGVMLGILPQARLVDVTHDVAAQDIMHAAFVLRTAIQWFPAGTVHLVVVDPGVGTDRRAVLALKDGQYFVGPDNGLFSLVFDSAPDELYVLDRVEAWLTPAPSATFHGRDLFAPVAARLAGGAPPGTLGSPAEGLTRLHWALPIVDDQGVRGWVVHVDAFGNCVTNIPRDLFEQARRGRRFKCYVGTTILDILSRSYAVVSAGEPVLLVNSSDLLEVAVFRGDASELLDIRTGTAVNMVFIDDRV